MKLIISSDGLHVINAEKVRNFWIDISQVEGYPVCADGLTLAYYTKIEDARKTLKSITDSLTCAISGDIVLHLEDGQ